MNEIDISSLSRFRARFDPLFWEQTNPMGHPEVYKLNEELLKQYAEDVVEIRKNIMKKVELYETYSLKDKNVLTR